MKIKAGNVLLTNSGELHLVLRVSGEGYVQATNEMSVQSRNEKKSSSVITIFDGIFADKKSVEEIEKLYQGIKSTDANYFFENYEH